jgi:hypothetical protein
MHSTAADIRGQANTGQQRRHQRQPLVKFTWQADGKVYILNGREKKAEIPF